MLAPPATWRRVLLRERRLLLLCAVSTVAHALVLGMLARSQPRLRQNAPPPALAVSLHGGAPAAPAPVVSAPADGQQAPLAPRSLSRSGPAPRASGRAALPAPDPATAASAPAPTRSGAGWDVAADGADNSAPHLPGMQAVQAPPSAALAYAVTRQESADGAASDAGAAFLDWRLAEGSYRLQVGGAGSALGEIGSSGQMADAGFVPLETRAGDALIEFDWTASRASFSRGALSRSAAAMVTSDAQDRASMLIRLAGIGLAGANQFDRPVELQVAGSDGVGKVVFEKIEHGDEQLATSLGPLATVHLRQQCTPGQACLEVWLAPARNWYPVQLRLTGADGSVLTQTVTSITAAQ